jgi:cholesterol oxidase
MAFLEPGPPTTLAPSPRLAFSERSPVGIRFTERMTGWWSLPQRRIGRHEPVRRDAYEEASDQGRRAGRRVELILTVVAGSLTTVLADSHHRAGFFGTATLDGLYGTHAPVTALVRRGRFRLFPTETSQVSGRRMDYRARIDGPDGMSLLLDGFKAIRTVDPEFVGSPRTAGAWRAQHRFWRDQTRLYFTLWGGGLRTQWGLGVLQLTMSDFLRQLTTMDAPGASGMVERFDTVARFMVFFGGMLRDTYGGPFARSRYAPPNWHMRTPRSLGVPSNGEAPSRKPEVPRLPFTVERYVKFMTTDGVELRLRRYHGTVTRRPIVLAPGFGVRASSFAIDTVPMNLVEYLVWHGWDVWLFDYRASPELDASRTQLSIDDIAARDWPAALREVARQTGSGTVDVIAHCVGGMSFMMSALGGHLRRSSTHPVSVGSAVCSAVAAHPIGPPLNELKAVARLGVIFQLFGMQSLRVTVHAADTFKRPFGDRLLKFYPTDDPCDNPVCRRIRFVFGESYLHARLNRHTHDAVIEMFGNPAERRPAHASLRALRQLARILSARELRNEDGERVYTTDSALANLDFRLALLSGQLNHIFLPEGLARTERWILAGQARGKTPVRDLEVIRLDDYAHMDSFIGEHAARDVFPKIVRWLAELPRGSAPPPPAPPPPTPPRGFSTSAEDR